MGVKYFCDKCGNECKSNCTVIPMYAYDARGAAIVHFKNNFLCDECTEKFKLVEDRLEHDEDFFDMTDDDIALMEYDFKVGDTVITDTGMVGVIESICDCDRCKARGFYEPKVKVTNGADDTIWITNTDKENGFISFYQIGKYKFGNIDKESVECWIENENNNIKVASKRLEEYEKQWTRLKRLESGEEYEDEEENSSEEEFWDWLL